MKFYQACFGKPNNVNWGLFNCSDNIPANLSSFYEKAENSNTPQNLNNDDMVDKDGNPICIYEILTQASIVAVSKIQYGSRDNMGRPKMFAHGFLFDDTEDILRDINNVLSISDDNFKFDIDETKQIPASLSMSGNYNLRDAMKEVGIDDDNLIKLMSCVYTSLTSATDYPLYLVSSKKDVVLKPLVYCIFSLIPYSLRYNLSVSNANNFTRAQFKNVMVVDKRYTNGYYFDLDTFETNLDLADVKNHPEKYPFIYRMAGMGIDKFNEYCNLLNDQLEKMQLQNTRDYNVVKLADKFLSGPDSVDKLDDQELTRFLIETSTYAPMQNNYVDSYIAIVAEKFNNRGLIPNEALMRRLQVRGDKTPSESFTNIYKQLQMKTLMQSGTDAVVKFLAEQRTASWERFVDWCKYVCNFENGSSMIEKYYALRINMSQSLGDIVKLYNECVQVISFAGLYNIANTKCYEITKAKLISKDSYERDYSLILDEYSNTFTMLNPSKSVVEKQRNIDMLINEYWNRFDITDFEFSEESITNYQCMEMENDTNVTYKHVQYLIRFFNYFEDDNRLIGVCSLQDIYPEVEKYLNFFGKKAGFTYSQLNVLAPKMQQLILKHLNRGGYNNRSFIFWYIVASFGYEGTGINPLKNMLKWNLPVIVSDDWFAKALDSDRVLHNLSKLIDAIDRFIEDFDNKSEEYKLLKKRLNAMCDLEDEINKQAKKEEARAKKEEARAKKEEKQRMKFEKYTEEDDDESEQEEEHVRYKHEKKAPDKKGLFFNLFGGSSKKKK